MSAAFSINTDYLYFLSLLDTYYPDREVTAVEPFACIGAPALGDNKVIFGEARTAVAHSWLGQISQPSTLTDYDGNITPTYAPYRCILDHVNEDPAFSFIGWKATFEEQADDNPPPGL